MGYPTAPKVIDHALDQLDPDATGEITKVKHVVENLLSEIILKKEYCIHSLLSSFPSLHFLNGLKNMQMN
jgi:hypothetical protein